MKSKILHIAYAVGICLVIGLLGSFVTQTSVNDWYLTLNKPFFTPPNWLFAPVWTLLYILMGIAAGIVWTKGFYHLWVKTALYHFVFQLLLNASWSIVFFGLKELFWALVVIVCLLILLIFTIRWFKVVSKTAAWLLIPYFIWVCYATLLTYKIWEMN
ncbi:tryptophan-rich sensory protein [Euzebyella marina]|uniref:Tryptophan-rich sensory protein n=1 Tax=Euzebyella marina TaxID=1761453 RepID=A0A3G2LAC8_9FLAO|nr:TspO/MBR family protein [Euzebyella marina]AYN69199.1 tryptophan-rich sensory protein [Euzebyella marina]